MPRCFLAKKSASNGLTNGTWDQQDTNNNRQDNEELAASHRSTVGSISAAKAVLSIQEPICPPPAHQASILATSSVMKAAMAATHNSKTLEPKTPVQGTPTLAWSSKAAARPPRRKKPLQRLPLNLTLDSNKEDSMGLTLLHTASNATPTTITTQCGKSQYCDF